MQGSLLRFYVDESQIHRGMLLWEWLLEKANSQGLRGGSAFRAIAGFGRRHELHEERFFELAGHSGVEIEFMVNDKEAESYLSFLRSEKIRVFYTRIPAWFDVIHPDKDDAPELPSGPA